ncbi:hypothetical protein BABAYKA_00110 [Brevundimonas phage vB_BpoS-Babayka]|uniref:Lipoprotein n=1 Tax=Brevundimonas phage vB_BpoS-Babayka TaxID=2948596 RepID=A0A9E7MUK8_9CAUD|nr:hypothetical protein BABAYKA_00110 [Brevundimonas phage vB_BpoS-Babayka]
MRNAIVLAALCGLLAACGPDNNPPSSGGGSGYIPPVDQPIQQDELTMLAAVPPTAEECGHRECGEIGYGFGYNFNKGSFGLGFGTGGVNFF